MVSGFSRTLGSCKVEEHGFCKPDSRAIRKRCLGAGFAFDPVDLLVPQRHMPLIERGAKGAQVDQEKLSGRRIATDSRVLA